MNDKRIITATAEACRAARMMAGPHGCEPVDHIINEMAAAFSPSPGFDAVTFFRACGAPDLIRAWEARMREAYGEKE